MLTEQMHPIVSKNEEGKTAPADFAGAQGRTASVWLGWFVGHATVGCPHPYPRPSPSP